MQCYGGPLDGHNASPSDIHNGKAVFGLVRMRSGFDFGKGDHPVFAAEKPTTKTTQTAEYHVRDGRLVHFRTRT